MCRPCMIYVRCGWWSSLWQYHISCVRQPSILFTLYVCVHTQHCWCSKEYMFALREGRSLCNQKVSCDAHHPSMILGLPSTKAIMAEQPNYVKNAPPPPPRRFFLDLLLILGLCTRIDCTATAVLIFCLYIEQRLCSWANLLAANWANF